MSRWVPSRFIGQIRFTTSQCLDAAETPQNSSCISGIWLATASGWMVICGTTSYAARWREEATVYFLDPEIVTYNEHCFFPSNHTFWVVLPLPTNVQFAALFPWRCFVWHCFRCFARTVDDCHRQLFIVLSVCEYIDRKATDWYIGVDSRCGIRSFHCS